jgi:hypothetical protein
VRGPSGWLRNHSSANALLSKLSKEDNAYAYLKVIETLIALNKKNQHILEIYKRKPSLRKD